ncbi:hypothetical protein RJ639_044497 [Escallonia herrerae]|uniref:Glutaredoxin domain-containing protein n=1 Tax=Escallonia herrerae TaxID=1293975 RepID=A0AA88WGQ6_9ASTE|nr:hypothetical protein RJ639_044497 [Escallonia herrerae]
MAGFSDKLELSENPKSSIFIRSLTMYNKPSGFYNSSFGSMVSAGSSIKGKVKKLCSLFESSKTTTTTTKVSPPDESQSLSISKLKPAKSFAADSRVSSCLDDVSIRLAGTDDRVVIYFTSLRGIRRTYEDCYAVRMIIRGFRVMVDERDISMDSAYKKELLNVLGKKNVSLPQVFIRGKYIGGAESVKQLHEVGELERMLKGLPVRPPGYVCEMCGDARFIPCGECSGSKKFFDEDDEQLKRCPECNENGLIRCPTCCT